MALIKILGYTYEIIEGNSERMDALGRYHVREQKIQIASNMCNEQKVSTVLHEIIEALDYHLEFNLNHNIIQALESTLYQVLTDNGVDLTPILKLENEKN